MPKSNKRVRKSPYTPLALDPIDGALLGQFGNMVKWLAPKEKDGQRGNHGLRWLENQFSFNDAQGNRRVLRSFGWFAFARNREWDQISPLMIDYMLIYSIYNRERGMFQEKSDVDHAVRLMTQAMTLLRPAIGKR